jgi:hypothetical protein
MRRLKTILTALIFTISATSIAQGWILYADQEHLFSINFTRDPDIQNFDYTSEYGATYPARTYSIRENGGLLSLTVVDYRNGEGKYAVLPDQTDDAPVTSLWLYDQLGSISYEASKLRQRGGKILYDNWHHIDLVEGLNLVIENSDGSNTYAGLYLHANRLYMMEATVPAGAPPQSLFQQSLSFLDTEGVQIRYKLSPERERTRIR